MKLSIILFQSDGRRAGQGGALRGSAWLGPARCEAVIAAGPMATNLTRLELPKLVTRDFTPNAATADALSSDRPIAAAEEPRFSMGGGSNFYETGSGIFYTDAELHAARGEKRKASKPSNRC